MFSQFKCRPCSFPILPLSILFFVPLTIGRTFLFPWSTLMPGFLGPEGGPTSAISVFYGGPYFGKYQYHHPGEHIACLGDAKAISQDPRRQKQPKAQRIIPFSYHIGGLPE